nr:ras-GEF domain-containing family member 1B-like isoform X1 [Oncorhynchus nerka]
MQNGHVNFEKFWEMAKQVSEFMVWKKVECPFEKDRKILQYLLTAPVFSEDTLCLASYDSDADGSLCSLSSQLCVWPPMTVMLMVLSVLSPLSSVSGLL